MSRFPFSTGDVVLVDNENDNPSAERLRAHIISVERDVSQPNGSNDKYTIEYQTPSKLESAFNALLGRSFPKIPEKSEIIIGSTRFSPDVISILSFLNLYIGSYYDFVTDVLNISFSRWYYPQLRYLSATFLIVPFVVFAFADIREFMKIKIIAAWMNVFYSTCRDWMDVYGVKGPYIWVWEFYDWLFKFGRLSVADNDLSTISVSTPPGYVMIICRANYRGKDVTEIVRKLRSKSASSTFTINAEELVSGAASSNAVTTTSEDIYSKYTNEFSMVWRFQNEWSLQTLSMDGGNVILGLQMAVAFLDAIGQQLMDDENHHKIDIPQFSRVLKPFRRAQSVVFNYLPVFPITRGLFDTVSIVMLGSIASPIGFVLFPLIVPDLVCLIIGRYVLPWFLAHYRHVRLEMLNVVIREIRALRLQVFGDDPTIYPVENDEMTSESASTPAKVITDYGGLVFRDTLSVIDLWGIFTTLCTIISFHLFRR